MVVKHVTSHKRTTTKLHKCYGLKKGTFLMINFTEGKTKTGSRLLTAARKRTKKETYNKNKTQPSKAHGQKKMVKKLIGLLRFRK